MKSGMRAKKCGQPLIEIGIHETIDATLRHCGNIRHYDCKKVERVADCEAVKISAAYDVAVLEHQRIVGGSVELSANRAFDPFQCVEHWTVHLRHTPQRIGILHSRIPIT